MTVHQDVQRASLRAMMTVSMLAVPEYSTDPRVLKRVGNVIGQTASHEERHVRASDSVLRSTSRVTSPERAAVVQASGSGQPQWAHCFVRRV